MDWRWGGGAGLGEGGLQFAFGSTYGEAAEATGHAFITRSPFHQLLAHPLGLPTAGPSVPEGTPTRDNMSPRLGAGHDYFITVTLNANALHFFWRLKREMRGKYVTVPHKVTRRGKRVKYKEKKVEEGKWIEKRQTRKKKEEEN